MKRLKAAKKKKKKKKKKKNSFRQLEYFKLPFLLSFFPFLEKDSQDVLILFYIIALISHSLASWIASMTSLSSQLSQIAASKSTSELDLKAQRIAHSQSLIFDKKTAGSQDFDTIYEICYEAFQELRLLDQRFALFERTIFSEQSKDEDRTQMTAAQNEELDAVLEEFLALVGGWLLLTPGVKALEWLVRRFR